MKNEPGDPIAAQRNAILGVLLLLSAAAWTLLAFQSAGSSRTMTMASPTMGMSALLFLAIWVVMMVAMMFPAAAPMILAFHRVQSIKRQRGDVFVATWIFVAAYMLVWSVSGIAAYSGALGAQALARGAALSSSTTARIGGGMLIAAGIYQLTPLKDLCLSKCRTPLGFIVVSWRDGARGALEMGLRHGVYCLGCCWLLFLILFPLGMMNVAAMAMITLVIFAEKTLPWSRPIARATAAALIAYGIAVVAAPSTLPTFMSESDMTTAAPAMPMNMPMR